MMHADDSPKYTALNWLPFLSRLMAILLGALHAWTAARNHSMNADGISYLDIGDAYMRGDWALAINSVWSPLYSWILGPVFYYLQPSMPWEFAAVHGVNFVIYLLSLVCFEFFWRQLLTEQQSHAGKCIGDASLRLPVWAWYTLGYTLFTWTSLSLIKIWSVTPDMLTAALVYLAAGLVVRLRMGATSWGTFLSLGIVLALGYLAKTVMFPLAFVFIGVAFLAISHKRQAILPLFSSLFVFLFISGFFIALISQAKGALTFGDASKITYVRHVNGLPYPHWQGSTPEYGQPLHPSRKIFLNPPIYEFGSPIGGTYPISYDPYYWYEGAEAQFNLSRQLKQLLASTLFYFDLFFRQQGVLLVAVVILYGLGQRRSFSLPVILQQWGITLVAFVTFGLYAPVLVAGRYIGAFVVLFWADWLAKIRLTNNPLNRSLLSLLSLTMIIFLGLNIIALNLDGFATLSGAAASGHTNQGQTLPPSWPGEVAQALHQLGIQPGAKVAVIGYAFDSFWARLARVQIVAEMLSEEATPFWLSDARQRDAVYQAFANSGAKAIVAEYVPGYVKLPDWHQVGNSNFYIYLLRQKDNGYPMPSAAL